MDGVAFVLPYTPNLAAKRTHRVYLKNMLLSEEADNLLPDWAFFVKAVVNVNDLRPTASRESFYEDEKLDDARAALGDCLRDYLVDLSRRDPARLERLIALHHLAIKALAVEDDEFYRLFIDWLPFETSLGDMTLGEYRKDERGPALAAEPRPVPPDRPRGVGPGAVRHQRRLHLRRRAAGQVRRGVPRRADGGRQPGGVDAHL